MIADNTTYNRAHGQLYWFYRPSADHFLCVSHAECVNFIITKCKHRKGNFISACCLCLCFEITYRRGSGSRVQQFGGWVHLKMFGNEEGFSPHWVGCALTAQGGEADLKFTEMSTLVWSDFDLKRWKHGTEDTLSSLFLIEISAVLVVSQFRFFAFSWGKKTFTVNVYINCELSIPHTSWTDYLISRIVRERNGSNVFSCILCNHHYHYLQLTSQGHHLLVHLHDLSQAQHLSSFIFLTFIMGTHNIFI